jgi:hypothetical protein
MQLSTTNQLIWCKFFFKEFYHINTFLLASLVGIQLPLFLKIRQENFSCFFIFNQYFTATTGFNQGLINLYHVVPKEQTYIAVKFY